MIDDDTYEDRDADPSAELAGERKSSRGWLKAIVDAEKAFEDYQERADNIDKLYANLGSLANSTRDAEFQLFWANIQVLGPSIYARPPVPVVVPKFKDRRPLYRTASELLERATSVAFDLTDIDGVMLMVRDDLNIVARGAPWVRYETKQESDGDTERVCIEHKDRKDFLHDPARKWADVGWVASRSWLTRKEMRKRFRPHSQDAYKDAEFSVRKDDKDNGGADSSNKAGVWEIWSKTDNKVLWVAPGCESILDQGPPHLKLQGFFPCPRPAYATVQRRSLIPVPDILYYKDQLDQINQLTGRIAALTEALKVRGFYPAGAGEVGDAIEAAMKSIDDRVVLVPISNWAAFGQGGDPIVWLPLEMIANTMIQLVTGRKQLIDDVYQIMGLSDIMRGSTEASETLGAQQLKANFGSVRIRDKQSEMVRVARDLVRIAAEIMAENFSPKTLLEMSQLELPTDAEIKKQIEGLKSQGEEQIKQQIMQAQQDPQMMQQVQANPQAAQQMMDQASQQIAQQLQPQIMKLEQQVTKEQVFKFLKDQKIRPFVLDIESDSTIQPDEQAEKAARSEFLGVLGQAMGQLMPLVQQDPSAAPFAGQILKFAVAPFRAGRELDGAVDDFVDQASKRAEQPQPNPEAEAATAEAQAKQQEMEARGQIETQKLQMAAQKAQSDAQMAQAKLQMDQQAAAAANELAQAKLQGEQQTKAAQIEADKWKAMLASKTSIEVAQIGAGSTAEQTELEGMIDAKLGIQEHEQRLETLTLEQAHQSELTERNLEAAERQSEQRGEGE
jgi:hypothetical protein